VDVVEWFLQTNVPDGYPKLGTYIMYSTLKTLMFEAQTCIWYVERLIPPSNIHDYAAPKAFDIVLTEDTLVGRTAILDILSWWRQVPSRYIQLEAES
jgi:hypothetical protein